MALHFKD